VIEAVRCGVASVAVWVAVFVSLLACAPPRALAAGLGVNAFAGYESWEVASGNKNSVHPGSPSGLTLGVTARAQAWVGRKFFFFGDGGTRFSYLSTTRSSGDTKVTSSATAAYLALDGGLGVPFTPQWSVEGFAGGDYAYYSKFGYLAEVEGYVPIQGESPLGGHYVVAPGLRVVYRHSLTMAFALDVRASTGRYTWYNPGTEENQTDTFSAFSLRITYRHVFNDGRPSLRKPDRGLRVADGIWVKSESTSSTGASLAPARGTKTAPSKGTRAVPAGRAGAGAQSSSNRVSPRPALPPPAMGAPPQRSPPLRSPPLRSPPLRSPPLRSPPLRKPPLRKPPLRKPPERSPAPRRP
jgi:hypothetical protein